MRYRIVEHIEESHTVWQSVDNIVGMERSLGAFWAALVDELRVIGGVHLAFVEGKKHWSTSGADPYCIYTGECHSYRASDAGDEPVTRGVLSVRIELWRKVEEQGEPVWPYARTPLIYVAYHGHPDAASDDVGYYRVDDNDFGSNQYGKPYDEGEDDGGVFRARTPLWIWNEISRDVDEWIESSWFFSVPLTAIRSYDDLREQVTEPVRKLLIENREPEDVFRTTKAIPAVAVGGR